MATITINGVEIQDDPRAVRRELSRVRRAEQKAESARRANRDAAQQMAEVNAYRLLHKAAKGDGPGYWDYYPVPSEHGSHYVRPVDADHGRAWEIHDVPDIGTVRMEVGCGGRSPLRIAGVITDRSGFVRGLAIEYDGRVTESGKTETMVFGFGVSGDQWHLADCPGITVDFFQESGQHGAC